MNEQILLKSLDSNLQKYLPHLKAEIPNFQRSYEWGVEQVSQFIEDLDNEQRNTNSTLYFFGPIITTYDSTSGTKQIIDGQQRLTTTTIFLAVVRDILATFSETSAEKAKYTIINHLIGTGDEYSEFKLTQSGELGIYLLNNIQKYDENSFDNISDLADLEKKVFSGSNSRGKGNINNVIRTYNLILNYFIDITEKLDTNDKKIQMVKHVFNVFMERFFIVEISSPNRTEAFQIFQTINGRGLNLSAADLIKSDFLGNSGILEEEIQELWTDIQIGLGDLKFSDFIRYYWNSSNNFTTARGLYKAVSSQIRNSDEIKNFLVKLYTLVPSFNELNGYHQENYFSDFESSQQLINILDELNNLGFKIYYPLYLSLVSNELPPEQILIIMKKVNSILIQNKIMNKGTNSFEKIFSMLALEINKPTLTKAEKMNFLIDQLNTYYEDENNLKYALSNYDFSADKKMIRYILRALENSSVNEKGYINDNNKEVHIEHIMPQTPKDLNNWGMKDEEEHSNNLWSLGNLTLWLGKNNSSLKNSDFDTKKNIYKISDVRYTRSLSNYSTWNKENIKSRNELLINEFLKYLKN